MSALMKATDMTTMSSREIARLTGKKHSNVCRDIKVMLSTLDIPEFKFESGYFDKQNQRRTEFLLPKNECLTLVAGYKTGLRYKIIQRWQELEVNSQADIFKLTRLQILSLAMEAEQENEQLKQEVRACKPKVAFHDQVIAADDTLSVREAAKIIGTGQKRLFDFLRTNKWINRRNEPYQAKIESGDLNVKLSHWQHPEKGLQDVITTRVTGKGLSKLQVLWSQRASHRLSDQSSE